MEESDSLIKLIFVSGASLTSRRRQRRVFLRPALSRPVLNLWLEECLVTGIPRSVCANACFQVRLLRMLTFNGTGLSRVYPK